MPDARHQAICRTQRDQFLQGTPPALASEGHRAILDETFCIAQIRNIFAGGALPAFPAALYSLLSGLVQPGGVTLPRFLQVRADRVEVYGLRLLPTLTAGIQRLDEHQWLPGRYDLYFNHPYLQSHTIRR